MNPVCLALAFLSLAATPPSPSPSPVNSQASSLARHISAYPGAVNIQAGAMPITLQQLAELTPSVRSNGDWFGVSVAISGNTVVIAAFDPNIEQSGTVYVYVKPESGWENMTQVATLTSSDNAPGFGASVSINDITIVVGAANTSNLDKQAAGPGAAYVYVQPTGGWVNMTESAKLTASDGQPGDAFGSSVSIYDAVIAVGAMFATDSSGNEFAGKAYVFVAPPRFWSGLIHETGKLTTTDSQTLNYLGASVAAYPTLIVAGATGHNYFQGAAYVYSTPQGIWKNMTQTAELTASDPASGANFGFSSALQLNTIVEGAVGAAAGEGAAYVYEEPPFGWKNATETAELRSPAPVQGGGFGQSASINIIGNAIAIGAPGATVGANQLQGAAYVYTETLTGWHSTTRAEGVLTSTDGAANDNFGASVSLSGTFVVVGAVKSGPPGSAYVFGQ
jgi:hypothetical protein